jgi:hypothetical protein
MESAKELIEAIKKKDIKPTPKWKYSIKNILIWIGFLFSVLLGAISFSVILFAIQQADFHLLAHMAHSRTEFLLGLLPFLWIISLVIFLILAIFSIKYSWKGYKFSIARLVLINAAISMLIGTACFISGGAEQLESAFAVTVKSYDSIEERKMVMWSRPEEGYLSGIVLYVDDLEMTIEAFDKQDWQIDISDAFISPRLFLESGEKIKILGNQKKGYRFIADEVRPWGGRNQGFGKGKGKKSQQE